MSKELKKLIREAFIFAYNKHNSKKLHENVESLKRLMSSGDINKVENVFREIKANPNLAIKYAWTPQGSANGELNPKQLNLLIQMFFENTDMTTKKNFMMSVYNQNNKALFNKAAKKIMSLMNIVINPVTLERAYLEGWSQMFLGTKSKSGEDKGDFEKLTTQYKGNLKNPNFGAYIAEVITGYMKNAYTDEMDRERQTSSLDKPSPVTGKSSDFGSGEDFGSDALNPLMDPGSDLSALGAGLEKTDDAGAEGDEYVSVAGEEEPGDEENVSADRTVGARLASDESTPAKRNAKLMIRRFEKSLYQAIEEFEKHGEPTEAQHKGFLALEMILGGMSPKEASEKLGFNVTPYIDNLKKKTPEFVRMVDDYLLRNGFVNSRGKAESFSNVSPKWISDAVKFKLTGKLPTEFNDDRRDVQYATGEPEGVENTSLNMRQMQQLVINTKKTAKALRQSGNTSKTLQAIDSLLNGISPETVAKNLGYENVDALSRELADLQITTNPQDIADSARSIKIGHPTKAVPIPEPETEDMEGVNESRTFWFLEEVIMESFIEKHLDVLMERVYKRLVSEL